jgi:hypothetical protein
MATACVKKLKLATEPDAVNDCAGRSVDVKENRRASLDDSGNDRNGKRLRDRVN